MDLHEAQTALAAAMATEGWEVVDATAAPEAAIVITCGSLDAACLSALSLVLESAGDVPAVVVSPDSDREAALTAIRCGVAAVLPSANLTAALLSTTVAQAIARQELACGTQARLLAAERRADDALAALSALPAPLLVVDGRGRIRFANQAAAELYQMAPHALIGREAGFSLDGDGTVNLAPPVAETVCTAYSRLANLVWEGQPAVLANLETERLAPDVRLDHRQFVRAVEQCNDSIVITDRDGVILYVNPTFEKISGFSREEAIGRKPNLVKSHVQDQPFYEKLWETILSGNVWEGRLINRRKDGVCFEEECTINPVRDTAGNIVNFIGVKRDVTQFVELEEELRHSQKLEAIGRLAGGVAHDFNNLLTVILGHGQLLQMRLPPDDATHQRIGEIMQAAERASGLTRQLLMFSRKESVPPRHVDLNLLIRNFEKMLRRLIGEDIELVTRLAAEPATIVADPGQIEQAIMNLVVNARDAMPDGGRLALTTEATELRPADDPALVGVPAGRYIALHVADTGCGMDEDIRELIFKPFFTTKEGGKGTGLGLATVYGIVKQSGGHITLDSHLGKGTIFHLFLPLVDGGSQIEDAPTPYVATPVPAKKRQTILLVEDETGVRDMAREMLIVHGYDVIAADLPEEALRLAREYAHPIDLLLTDVIMPGMSGIDLAREVKALRPSIGVAFMSGYTDRLQDAAAKIGASFTYLQKPFTPQELYRAVEASLTDGRPAAGGKASP